MRLSYLLAVAALAGLSACSGSQVASERSSPNTGRAESFGTTTTTLNVPELMGRNIDQVRRTLGTPKETTAQTIGIEPTREQMVATKGQDWINTFDHNGTIMVVTFNASNRKVRDIVLVGSDEDVLLREANLSLTSPDYLVLPVMSPSNSGELIGMRIVARR